MQREWEFDNGTGRQRGLIISAIRAANPPESAYRSLRL